VDYLVALGHKRIARVAGLAKLRHTQVRTTALEQAMARHGLPAADVVTTDYSGEEGMRATRTLLSQRDRPTAVIYDNDIMAVAALGVAQEMGLRVPDDVSIIAWDDSPLCQLVRPALTALSRDVAAYGAHAAHMLTAQLDEGVTAATATAPDATPTLVVRTSTSRVANQ
jgi:DNA-binding LacI/PurR family transcriptional regulator